MKILILCLSSLSGAATLARIVLPALSCRDDGCKPSGSLDKVDHLMKRSTPMHVLDAVTTNMIVKRNNKKIGVVRQAKDSKTPTKQQALPSNPQDRSPLTSDRSKVMLPAKVQATSTKSPSNTGVLKINDPVRQQGKISETGRRGGSTADTTTSKQLKLNPIDGSHGPQSSSNSKAISSKFGHNNAVNSNHGEAISSKKGLNRAARSKIDSTVSQDGAISSGRSFQGQQTKMAERMPLGKVNGHILGQQSGKRETSSRSILAKEKSPQSKATLESFRGGAKTKSGSKPLPDLGRGRVSRVISNRQGESGQVAATKKRLCRRGNGRDRCDPSETQPFKAPSQQQMEEHENRQRMEEQLKTQASLDLRKARNSKATNRLTTGILGTGLTSSITSTSATMPGLCCHGMACGSAKLTCAAVATGSLGAAGICLGCVAVGLTAYKAVQDDKNAKEMEDKLNHAYGEVQRQKEGHASHSKRISEERSGREALAKEVGHERTGREALAKEVGDTKTQIAETKSDVGKTLVRLDTVGNNANTALTRIDSTKKVVNVVNTKAETALHQVDSTKKAVNEVNSKADTALTRVDSTKKVVNEVNSKAQTALDRTESLGKGVTDTKNQVKKTNENLQDVRAAAEGARLDAIKASSSYGELKRTHSERLMDHSRKLKALEIAMEKARIPVELDQWMHNSPYY